MRNKASGLLKQILTGLATMAKAKTMAIKSKTKAIKTRLVIFSLLQNRKFLVVSSLSDKLNALMGRNDKISKEVEGDVSGGQRSPSIALYNSSNAMWIPSTTQTKYEDDADEEKYPDLSHSLFESEEMELGDQGASVIEIVKKSKEDRGEEFRLEDEIDRVADLFIQRFHCQMRMQKQLSLKRRQEMTETSP
ncbi:P-loop containing nucleoside triphosphate hydrolases superfamily protein isoform 1 [Hibiscus syriacus]|uniref:P-loop containing nucleoside triphosphate hydrolases superfamily protein isoform 1 n=1 Tax=Hibiscus syriacus TaxID=106335 RepID=A0A6A3D3Z6_HIBSY|nr:uncharacterized protein LOC120169072 [Hibiscus syriacus]KAE8736360.1 P-loop containing nucleoside triphosphate hydrolases superfamily protein isoform 1 [Hibiscus syriacus]